MAITKTEDDAAPSQRESDAPIRVLISDPAELIRQGIRRVLGTEDDIAIVEEEARGLAAEDLVSRLSPDVVLLGLDRIGPQTLEMIGNTSKRAPSCRIVLLVGEATVGELLDAAAAGASGLLLRDSRGGQLAQAIRTAAEGEWSLEPRMVTELVTRLTIGGRPMPILVDKPLHPAVMDLLTSREQEVLLLLTDGRHNPEIATALGISVGTVKTHLRRIYQKLGVSDRTAAVAVAVWGQTPGGA
jgi:DNA-binding NarL/FixJ family response regulator